MGLRFKIRANYPFWQLILGCTANKSLKAGCKQMWKHAIQHVAEVCLEGLSRVKPCNAVGRAAMTSDVHDLGYSLKGLLQPVPQELSTKLENNLRMVDNYVKVG